MSLASDATNLHLGHAPNLQIQLFGPFTVYLNGELLAPLHSRKGSWLLALLILKYPQPVDRTWLAATLWPDSDHRDSLQNLRNTLNNLRNALGQQRHRIQSPTPGTLRLDLTQAIVDIMAFDSGIKRGDPESLAKSAALYRGSLLEGCLEEWVVIEREHRQQACLEALETLAGYELATGEAAMAVRYLKTAIRIDTFRETAQCALMTALAAAGDYSSVTQVYREFRIQLRDQLNTHPAAVTVALYERIRARARQAAAGGAISQPSSSIPGRVNDLSSVTPPDSIEEIRVGGAVNHNLPPRLTSFIGRDKDLTEIKLLITNSRLLTLTGAGGSGKTRLAIEVAAESVASFTDGVWLVELADTSDPARVVQAAATILNIREQSGVQLVETLVNALQTKVMLLVFDNCEHLLQACVDLASALLRGCPTVRLLSTSRERLGIAGEQIYRVPSLSVPLLDTEVELGGARESDSVRLFEARARLVCIDFRVNSSNVAAVTHICRRLDGIPLAIELAAARVRSLSVEDLRMRIVDRFDLLTGGDRSALPRQQTISGLIDWSYDLLNVPEKEFLQLLSVFAGGWNLNAAEAVCGCSRHTSKLGDDGIVTLGNKRKRNELDNPQRLTLKAQRPSPHVHRPDEVLDLLTSLVDKSMVQCEERGGVVRYRLLETIRQYAQERLAKHMVCDEVRARHLDYFLVLAESAEPGLQGTEQSEWLQRLEVEHDNLCAALDWSLTAKGPISVERGPGGDPNQQQYPILNTQYSSLRLCAALQMFWQTRGRLTEGRGWCERTLKFTDCDEETKLLARVLNGAGTLARMQCDFAAASCHIEKSLNIRRKIDDRSGIASSLIGLGNVAISLGDNASAISHYQESLNISLQDGDRSNAASSLIGLGIVTSSQGDYAASRAYYEDSLAIMRQLGAPSGIARTLSNLGNAAFDQGDHISASNYYRESLVIEEEIGNRSGIAHVLGNLGNVAWSQGDFSAARTYYQRSLAIKKEIGDLNGIGNTLNNLGTLAQDLGDYADAQSQCKESLNIYSSIGDRKGITASLEAFAGIAAKLDLYERATLLWGAAAALREQIGFPRPPHEQRQYDQNVSQVRKKLRENGDFDRVWEAGRTMKLQDAVALALRGQGL